MKHPKFSHSFEVVADFPSVLGPLAKLASNFYWSWDYQTRDLFRAVDKTLWDACHHNPMQLLHQLPRERAAKLAEDTHFLALMNACERSLDAYLAGKTWFDETYPGRRADTTIAYFCAEFGITEGLPIYSGGLGILAGDHMKAASDLGLPLVGVGLLYARGYFRQRLNHDGWQQEFYPEYDYFGFPLELMRDGAEQPIRIEVEFPDRTVTCQVWRADVGRVPLYLLDSNVLENEPTDQGITDTLYGGDEEMRIRQEMILGVGGMRALRALGIAPTVCHMNEGHAAFLSVERIRQFMLDHATDQRTARQVVVAGNVFTTHTIVPAGFDVFDADLLKRYMGRLVEAAGFPFEQFVKLGKMEPENEGRAFNMAVLAIENSDHVNGVSKLHAKVTRSMFSERWAAFPEDEVPIDGITNGVHTLTWISRRMARLFDEYLGSRWRYDAGDPEAWANVDKIPDDELWGVRENERGDLVRYVRRRLQRSIEGGGGSRPDFNVVGNTLDPRVLTIGFARRFATYKRAALMLTDRERLKSMLFHPERPVQFVIAGKAHPRDDAGKELIQRLVNFMHSEGAGTRMVFVEDYDMEVARRFVQGVDVWLNTPRRPMEASGTSGMKVVPNGGINFSVRDGWWDEAYHPSLGLAIGEATEFGDPGHQDWLDSRSLYAQIESEIAAKFYHRVDNGIPTAWIAMMKASIRALAPQYSTARMVSDYARRYYLPASDAYLALQRDDLAEAKAALRWRDKVRKGWHAVRLASVTDSAARRTPKGSDVSLKALVSLGDLTPNDVSVEAVVGKIGANRDLIETAATPLEHKGKEGGEHVFEGTLGCLETGHRGYTVRVVPRHDLVSVSHELPLVVWEA